MLRTLTERLTKSLCLKRKLPASFGGNVIWVSPVAGLRFLFRPMSEIDPVLFQLVTEFVHEGSIVWDIGANVGLFSFSAASLAGEKGLVVALEPDAWLVQLLRRSCSIQPSTSASVRVVPAAVAQSVDLRTFHIATRSRSANFLEGYGSTQTGGTSDKQIVITLTLDWLAERFPLPNVVKIDVEGAEIEVFQGSSMLLEKKRPVILCEVTAESSAQTTEFLHSNGYRIYDGEVPKPERKVLSVAPWNTIAIPA